MFFIYYLIMINLLGLILVLNDKQRAIKNKWRIKESTLLIVAILGGSIGVQFGMNFFHHKTRKFKFKYGVPLVIVLQLLLLYFFLK
ncbi:MAG: DUF1294 domain-containing protein [Clostridiales bacterium]|nr:DUF1294 domain-containing protein [Clostridiales bacterium]